MYWDESFEVVLQSFSDRHIDVLIKESPQASAWRVSFVYGEARVENRQKTWDILRRIKSLVA